MATELETTRESLRISRDRERALETSRRDLVTSMSHDLRTPLAGLRALAEGLEDGVIEDQNAALTQMRQTVERMNGLVGDLFELSRLNAGRDRPVRSRPALAAARPSECEPEAAAGREVRRLSGGLRR